MPESYNIESMLFAIIITLIVSLSIGIFIKTKPMKERNFGWGTQDWIWMVSFLLYAQLFTVLYKEMVMDVVSFVSTFVSTALGAVAIYISVREATKGDDVKDEMNRILGEMREKLNQMDTKMNKFDPDLYAKRNDKIAGQAEQIKENVGHSIASEESLTPERVIEIVNEEVDKAAEKLKNSLDLVDQNKTNNAALFSVSDREAMKYINKIIQQFDSGHPFSVYDIYITLEHDFKLRVSQERIRLNLMSLVNAGILKLKKDEKDENGETLPSFNKRQFMS